MSTIPIFYLHGLLGFPDELNEIFKDSSINLIGINWYSLIPSNSFYSIQDIAKVICHYIRSTGHKSVRLLGYSMGGRLAMQCAYTDPDLIECLFLESAHFGYENKDQKQNLFHDFFLKINHIKTLSFEQFLDYWYQQDLFCLTKLAYSNQDLFQKKMLDFDKICELMINLHVSKQPFFIDVFHSLNCPIFYITGLLDTKYSHHAKSVSNILNQFNYCIISNADHNVHVSNPSLFKDWVLRYS